MGVCLDTLVKWLAGLFTFWFYLEREERGSSNGGEAVVGGGKLNMEVSNTIGGK